MTTYNTGNPIGSTAVKDLYDNAENLDVLVNDKTKEAHPDRLGVVRKTWHGMEQDFQDFLINSGYQNIGDYAAGLNITARNQIFWRDGELYRAGAVLELPYTTTGDWGAEEGLFVAVGDQALRQELAEDTELNGGALIVAKSSVSLDTINDLVSIPINTITASQSFIVGRYSSNINAGGGHFYWDEESEEDVDGGNVFQSDSSQNGRWVRVEREYSDDSYGIPESGDVTLDVQRLFDSAPEGSVVVINRDHEVSTQIRINKPLTVRGTGSIYCNNFTQGQGTTGVNALVRVSGEQSEIPVTRFAPTTALAGSVVISVLDSTGLSHGDVIEIISDAIVPNGREYSYKKQHVQIESINGNQITLRNPLAYTYASSEVVSVYRHNYLDGFTWEGVSVATQKRTDINTNALLFLYCVNSCVKDSDIKEGHSSALQFTHSFNCKIDNCTAGLTTESQSLQYGGLFANCSYCRATNSYFYSRRTAFDISESDNCYLGFSTLMGRMATHTGTDHLIEGVISSDRAVIRSQNTTISNCDISTSGTLMNSISAGVITADESARNGGLLITNNRLTLSNAGEQGTPVIYIASSAVGNPPKINRIIGNDLVAVSPDAAGISIYSAGGPNYGAKTIVSNNYIESGGNSIIFSRTKGVIISNNIVLNKGVGSGILRFAHAFDSDGPASQNVIINGNSVEFSRAGGAKRFIDMGGAASADVRRVIVTNNSCRGDTANVFGGIPPSEIVNVNNLTDS